MPPAHLLIVNFQKRSLQYELRVLLPLLEQLEHIKKRPEYQSMVLVLEVRLPAELPNVKSNQLVKNKTAR